jgi:hypothetical protein
MKTLATGVDHLIWEVSKSHGSPYEDVKSSQQQGSTTLQAFKIQTNTTFGNVLQRLGGITEVATARSKSHPNA